VGVFRSSSLSCPSKSTHLVSALARNVSSHSLLEFKPVLVDSTVDGAVQMWAAADNEYAFTIALTTRILVDTGEETVYVDVPKPVFVAYVSWPDGSQRCQIDRCFKTFDAAVRKCSKFTRETRRQIAYHEAGHAVVAWLLGFQDIWIDLKFDKRRAVTGWRRNTLTPDMLTDGALLGSSSGGGGDHSTLRSSFVRALQDELLVAVAGLVSEVQLAGYRTGYVEPEVPGRAVQMVRAACGLPICGCKNCRVRFDHESILKLGLPICGRRNCATAPRGIDLDDIVGYAEAEAFALLEANWRAVKHLVNKLCRCDRFLLPDLAGWGRLRT
jgi:hypothetical protein